MHQTTLLRGYSLIKSRHLRAASAQAIQSRQRHSTAALVADQRRKVNIVAVRRWQAIQLNGNAHRTAVSQLVEARNGCRTGERNKFIEQQLAAAGAAGTLRTGWRDLGRLTWGA